ncbi:hypothetical protein CKAH01_06108 [Colletotrichum kahawae]|uniref:Uncharacterized protein n=1 Tax=Colletotrichum kahawae TaxID=34407 RepID=A0AAD9YA67_COLKA|nr:hypothetical protein CKAH01_06108 [Colletotrichum kahawae]
MIQRSCLWNRPHPPCRGPNDASSPFRGPILPSRFKPPTAKTNAQLPNSNVESALHRSPPGLNHRPKRSYPFQPRLRLASLTIRVLPQRPRVCYPLREPCRAQLHIFARAFRPSWQVDMLHEPHVPGPSTVLNPRAVCPGKRPSFLSLRRFSSPGLVDSGRVNEPTPEQLSASSGCDLSSLLAVREIRGARCHHRQSRRLRSSELCLSRPSQISMPDPLDAHAIWTSRTRILKSWALSVLVSQIATCQWLAFHSRRLQRSSVRLEGFSNSPHKADSAITD